MIQKYGKTWTTKKLLVRFQTLGKNALKNLDADDYHVGAES